MKKIELNGWSIELKNELSEISIHNFQAFASTFKKKYEFECDQYTEMLSLITNLTIDELEVLPFPDLIQLVDLQKETNINNFNDSFEGKTSFEFDGKKYMTHSDGKTFEFLTKEMFTIKSWLKDNPDNYIGYLAAIIFQELDSEGNRIKDFSVNGIRERELIFGSNMTMDLISPYILKLAPFFTTDVK